MPETPTAAGPRLSFGTLWLESSNFIEICCLTLNFHAGPEVDYVIERENQYIPIEIKWTAQPTEKDYLHLTIFLKQYGAKKAYLICQTPKWIKLTEHIIAIPWQDIDRVFD